MPVPEQFIEQVRTRSDIVEVVSQTVALKRTGKNFSGLCPFHSEKTPSFSVSPDKQIFYCFGCHAGGDVFKFVQMRDNVDFISAVRILAERAGLTLPEQERSPEEDRRYRDLEAMYQACELAAAYFHSYLKNSPHAAEARAYVERRGLSAETIDRFRIGFAPQSWDSLQKALAPRGVKIETLVKVGLVRPSDRGQGFYDLFRNRVMFPICNSRGRVIAFGGRVLDDSLPKYLNSSETPLFNKGRNLYALNIAREAIRSSGQAIMVEGYMDTIALHQAGITNVVASLGTALTSDQAGLLQQYAREVIIAYDADAAGERATLRGLEIMSASGCVLRVATVPDGKDPDEYVRTHGRAAAEEVFRNAVPFIKYRFRRAAAGQNLMTTAGKQAVLRQVMPLLARVTSAVELDDYLQFMASELQIEPGVLRREVSRGAARAGAGKPGPVGHNLIENRDNTKGQTANNGNPASKLPRGIYLAEQALLRAMLESDEARVLVAADLGAGGFCDAGHRELAELMLKIAGPNEPLSPAQVLDQISSSEIYQLATRIFLQEVEYSLSIKAVADYIRTIKEFQRSARIQQLLGEIREAQAAGRDANELVREYQDLIRDAKGSKRGR
ncbi:MAG: DNA primase [Chloroflexota bacterium]